MSNPLKRIKAYLDYKGIKISTFEKSVGLSNGSFGGQLKRNRTIGLDKLENILKTYGDLDAHWVLTGGGSMLKGPQRAKAPTQQLNYERTIEALNQVIVAQQKTIAAMEKLMEMSTSVNPSQSGTQTHQFNQ